MTILAPHEPHAGAARRGVMLDAHGHVLGAASGRNQSGADFQVCCIAGFQTRGSFERARPPTWKSALQQVGKPALRADRAAEGGSVEVRPLHDTLAVSA